MKTTLGSCREIAAVESATVESATVESANEPRPQGADPRYWQ
jgi:hypothetical protein